MNPSLSVLLPVHNAQDRLADSVARILDILPDLTNRFELLIIDDGSTDDTGEVARDLAAQFPQVNFVRHPVRLGLTESVQTGLDHSEGEIVLVGDERHGIEPDDLSRLWKLREDPNLVLAREPNEASATRGRWIETLMSWGPREEKPAAFRHAGVQLIRRNALDQLRLSMDDGQQLRTDAARIAARGVGRRPTFLERLKRLAIDE